jgi:hypothetical protein
MIVSHHVDFALPTENHHCAVVIPQLVIMSSPTNSSLSTAGATAAGAKVKRASVMLALTKYNHLFEAMDSKIELLTTENTLL